MDINTLKKIFKKIFSIEECHELRCFFSPGRINLIGEHTDYNGGHVFPCAISSGTYGIVRKRQDRTVRMFSMNFANKGIIELHLDQLENTAEHNWAKYPRGMIRSIQEAGWALPYGMDVLIYGNIPNGAGLSSSASLEILTGVMVNELFEFQIERLDLVQLGKKTENEFIGVNSGLMDQFAVCMGKKNNGILLDCNTLKYEYTPLNLAGYKIIIMNTNKRRELADSKYNERRRECEQALIRLQKGIDIHRLCEIGEREFEAYKARIHDDVLVKRAKHAVYENQRALYACRVLKNGDLNQFGWLMNESHVSLRDDYETTGIELDTLVQAAWKQEGVIGARMTGAGFGGCAIAIVQEEAICQFILEVGREYQDKIGFEAGFYIAESGDGAKELL